MAKEDEQDWLKLHRRILENDFLRNDQTAFYVFIKLLLLVGRVKGEWSGSARKLADNPDIQMSYTTLYKVLARLEKENMIKQESKQRYTTISICNWNRYQERKGATKRAAGKQPVSSGGAAGKQPTPVKKSADTEKIQKQIISDQKFYEIVEAIGQTNQLKFLDGRKQKLKKRLETFTYEEILDAARNCGTDDFMTGNNPQNKNYATFDYLMQSDEKLEKWLTANLRPARQSVMEWTDA